VNSHGSQVGESSKNGKAAILAAIFFGNSYKHPKAHLPQYKGIISSATYTVPQQVETFVDSRVSQDAESSKSGEAAILAAIFSEITINTPKLIYPNIKVLSHLQPTPYHNKWRHLWTRMVPRTQNHVKVVKLPFSLLFFRTLR